MPPLGNCLGIEFGSVTFYAKITRTATRVRHGFNIFRSIYGGFNDFISYYGEFKGFMINYVRFSGFIIKLLIKMSDSEISFRF
uniref:Transposase n=1 Tax=Strongyloides venezuelensis TaxID=75913 RepID=A0A0K0G575_STRVS